MYDPVVTDRDSVCIFSQIVDYGLCTLKSFFAVRDPFCRIAGIQKFLKYITISIFFRGSIEIQLVFFPKRFQLFQIFSTKNFWNNINWQKEFCAIVFPTVFIRKTTTKQDRVDMRMKVHFRSPGMKDTDITCRCTKIFWVSGQVIYGCRSSVIKNIVK